MISNRAKALRLSCQESINPSQETLSPNPEISALTETENRKSFYSTYLGMLKLYFRIYEGTAPKF